MTCIITGCALHDEASEAVLWGDLYEVGDCWVFNGFTLGGKAQWQYGEEACLPDVIKTLSWKPATGNSRFISASHGVLVIPKAEGTLNQAALRYLKR